MNQMIFSIRQLLKQVKNEEAVKFFESSISQIPPDDHIARFRAYERGISAFLDHKRFEDALRLHKKMFAEDRVRPSCGLWAKMLVCSSIVKSPHKQRGELSSLFDRLSRVVSFRSYSDFQLCQLLEVMKSHPLLDSQFVSNLVDKFVDSRGSRLDLKPNTINELIRFYAHVGSMDTAENLVASHQDSSSRPQPAHASPYTTLISELMTRGFLSSSRLKTLLDKMRQSQIKVDLPLLNVLVQAAVRKDNFHQAFDLYETILKDTAPHMIPDSFVFGSLFNALQRTWTSRSRSLRCERQPPNAPTPRQLFRQMLECHVLAIEAADPRTHPVVRISTLNVALRVFMLSGDYAAAFVTLQTFSALNLKPDVRSYRFVLTILLAHLKLGHLQATDQSSSPYPSHRAIWATNFLGGPARVARIQPEDMRPEFAAALLEFAVGGTEYRTPTLAMVLGDEEAPLRKADSWDVEPLERLVARAILATMQQRSANDEQAERALLEKLAPYFYEMVPDKLWRGRRLRRATG
jgi:hypothetical protein